MCLARDGSAKVRSMVFELLLSSWVLVFLRLCGELLMERSRRTTICKVAHALPHGGVVLDRRARDNTVVILVPPQHWAPHRGPVPADEHLAV
jgi:hypothetical protein